MIRLARPADFVSLQSIERAAGESFRLIGMDAIADAEPPSVPTLLRHQRAGHAWVWLDGNGDPGGYLLLDVVDGSGHVEQVSVDPRYARRGIGAALISVAIDHAEARGVTTMTLTTFRDVPWNRPYYERLGFEVVPANELTPGLARRRDEESAAGLDRWPRVAMRCQTGAFPAGSAIL